MHPLSQDNFDTVPYRRGFHGKDSGVRLRPEWNTKAIGCTSRFTKKLGPWPFEHHYKPFRIYVLFSQDEFDTVPYRSDPVAHSIVGVRLCQDYHTQEQGTSAT